MALTWDHLFQHGSIVTMAISRWPARVRLTAADLGLDMDAKAARALALGQHRLLPPEAFAEVNAAANHAIAALRSASLPFGMMWGARFVPHANIESLGGRLHRGRQAFVAGVDAFIARYEAMKEQTLPTIRQALNAACRSPEVAQAAFERVSTEYPPPDVVRGRFGMCWSVFEIKGSRTEGWAEAALHAEELEVRNAIAEMVRSLRESVIGKLATLLQVAEKGGGKLQRKSIDAAIAVLDHVIDVNVLGDAHLARHQQTLRALLHDINLEEPVPEQTLKALATVRSILEETFEPAVADAERYLIDRIPF